MQCPVCQSLDIMEGSLTSMYGVFFTEAGTENKFRPNSYAVVCRACRDCGTIFDARTKPKKSKKKPMDDRA